MNFAIQENDLLNLRQAETSNDNHNNNDNDENNYGLVRGLSTLQRHVSLRLQTFSSHLKKDAHETINPTIERLPDETNEEEVIRINNSTESIKHTDECKVC